MPGQSKAIVRELAAFLENRDVIGWVLLGTMIFFSSLAFTVLEKAMSVIFLHRFAVRRRHFAVSALLPYCYILFLGVGLLIVTLVASALEAFGQESIDLFGRSWSLGGVSGGLLYLLGIGGELFVLTSIYLVMPVGRLSLRHAFIGAVTAAVLWEATRHVLVWYFATLSQVSVVYGSLTTSIVVLLQSRDCSDGVAAGRPGDFRIRARGQGPRTRAAQADTRRMKISSPRFPRPSRLCPTSRLLQ